MEEDEENTCVKETPIQTSQCCIVSYRGHQARAFEEAESEPLLLAIYCKSGVLHLYRNILAGCWIDDDDKQYIDFLLRDLKVLAIAEPQNLFRQLNELNSGPLVTENVEMAGGQIPARFYSTAVFFPL